MLISLFPKLSPFIFLTFRHSNRFFFYLKHLSAKINEPKRQVLTDVPPFFGGLMNALSFFLE
jgi:hypothetical protein